MEGEVVRIDFARSKVTDAGGHLKGMAKLEDLNRRRFKEELRQACRLVYRRATRPVQTV